MIDSKVPLDAFLHFPTPRTRPSAPRSSSKHAGQLRTHVDQLAKKEYWRQFERSPEIVVAFIPGDRCWRPPSRPTPGCRTTPWPTASCWPRRSRSSRC